MRVAATGFLLVCATAVGAQNLEQVEIRPLGDGTRVVLHVQGAMEHKAFRLHEPERIVVDLVGAVNNTPVATRAVPGGPVAQVRVSQFATAPVPVTRLVADLRDAAEYDVQRRGDEIVLRVHPQGKLPAEDVAAAVSAASPAPAARPTDAGWASDPAASPYAEDFDVVSPEDAVAALPPAAAAEDLAPAPPPVRAGTGNVTPERPSSPVTADVVPMTAPEAAAARVEERAYADVAEMFPGAGAARAAGPEADSGGWATTWESVVETEDTSPRMLDEASTRRINLDVQGADIRTVLRTLADYSGKNIIASREVEGQVSASLKDAPWQSALEAILKSHGFGYVEEDGIIRVGVLQKIRNEELEEVAAERKREELLPIETRVVRLEFAAADELKSSLKEMLTSRGRLQVDERTNALIVTDIQGRVLEIAEMAQDLDSRTPQVEIVSKLIDVSAEETQNLGIQWNAVNLTAGDGVAGASVDASNAGPTGQLRIGTVQSWGQLDMVLDAMARNRKANIVSNPNITTVNNREAKILVGSKIPLIVADEAGNAITQLTTIGIQMRVTPHVNSDRTITLDLHPEVSELSSQATVQGGVIINTSEADTRVIVENGETAIIGGLIRDVQTEVKTGIPVLKDIPGVGWLFRNSNEIADKRELIIFVTPRMIEGTPTAAPKG
jgi:type II secretory pathway component GspD/PulD (secretin)